MKNSLSASEKLRIKKFFEKRDPREYVKAFISQSFGTNDPIPRVRMADPIFDEVEEDIRVPKPDKTPTEPSLIIEVKNGAAFDEFHKRTTKHKLKLTIDLFGKLETISDIDSCQCPIFNSSVVFKLPVSDDKLVSLYSPVRLCLSTKEPSISFVGFGSFDWRKVLVKGRCKESVDMIGCQNEITGVIHLELKLVAFPEGYQFSRYTESYDLQLRKEALEKVEAEREFAKNVKLWWSDLKNHIDCTTLLLSSNELGSGKLTIFDMITPFTVRSLMTPGHCLRFAYLLSPMVSPSGNSVLPNWALTSSLCSCDRGRHNVLASLLRGFGLRAYVVVAQPKCFVVSLSSTVLFFDANTGKFTNKPPQHAQTVQFVYNDEGLYANLHPDYEPIKIDWDLDNPIKWMLLKAPQPSIDRIKPSICDVIPSTIDEEGIEYRVKDLIERHRQTIGLETRWDDELQPLVLPTVDCLERKKITGQPMGLFSMIQSAIQSRLKPYHDFRAAPAVTNSIEPGSIFNSLVKCKGGSQILCCKDDDSTFTLVIRVTQYPNGLLAVWSTIGVQSVKRE